MKRVAEQRGAWCVRIAIMFGVSFWAGCHAGEDEVGEVMTSPQASPQVIYDSEHFRGQLLSGEERRMILAFDEARLSEQGVTLEQVAHQVSDGMLGGTVRVEALGEFGLVSVTMSSPVMLDELEALSGLMRVHQDIEVRAHTTSANAFINQPIAVQEGHLGTGVSVAVLDTGVDWAHQDFGTCTAPGSAGCRVVYAQDFAADDASRDEDGHGTNVAAIVTRVAPGADIVSLDVFDGDVASSSTILAALNWVVMHRATHGIGVVNMSLGSGYYDVACSNTVFAQAMQTLRQNGIVPVGSSGNDGFTDGLAVPACDPGVLSVGAVYDRSFGGVLYSSCADATSAPDQVACFSNTAPFLDVLAPGVSMSAGGLTMTGTSQAAPVISAALAVLQSAYPQESVDERIARLKRSGKVTDARTGEDIARVDFASVFDEEVPCEYTLSPVLSLTHESLEGVVEIDVATTSGCAWGAQVTQPWAIVDGRVRQGSGRLEVWLDANSDVTAREVDVVIEGAALTVTQEGEPLPSAPDTIDVNGWISLNWWRSVSRRRRVPMLLSADTVQGSTLTQVCVQMVRAGEVFGVCDAWMDYSTFGMVAMPDEDADYEMQVWFRDEFGATSREPMRAQITLDRAAPQDGHASLMQTPTGWDVTFESAQDAGTGVAIYRVYARQGRAPGGCFGLPGDTLVHQGRSAGVVQVSWPTQPGDVFFRVCAYDRAGNMSQGVVASTQDVHGF